MKKELLRWDSNPRHTAYEADALPTELPRQFSWLGQIKVIQGKEGNQSNLRNLINRQTQNQHQGADRVIKPPMMPNSRLSILHGNC